MHENLPPVANVQNDTCVRHRIALYLDAPARILVPLNRGFLRRKPDFPGDSYPGVNDSETIEDYWGQIGGNIGNTKPIFV
jgi:hypothetical protein